MAYSRQSALEKVTSVLPVETEVPSSRISNYFEKNYFGLSKMKELLSTDDFKSIEDAIKNGSKIDEVTANAIAVTVKNWAMNKGATHFSHWFQPH